MPILLSLAGAKRGGASTPVEALARARLGQRLANLEPEVVHRGLLAHAQVLALRLALRLLGRAGDIDGDLRLDLGMQVNRDDVQAERLDRVLDRDVAAVDLVPGGGQRLGDVARRHRAVELPGLARLADDDHRHPVELAGDLVRGALELVIARLEIGASRLELLLVGLGRPHRLAARQEEIAGVAVLHPHRVADMAELADALQQYDVHGAYLRFVSSRGGGAMSAARERSLTNPSMRPRAAKTGSVYLALRTQQAYRAISISARLFRPR